jgi:hypothetical protein
LGQKLVKSGQLFDESFISGKLHHYLKMPNLVNKDIFDLRKDGRKK